jgi:phosphate transport system substrate-binding protein
MKKSRLSLAVALGFVAILGTACAPAPSGATDSLIGTYFGSGSGAGLEQVQALTKRFTALHPGAEFKLDDAGSETAAVLVGQGQIDLGYASRDLTPEEAAKVTSIPLVGAGTAVAVNAANLVRGLTKDQVRDIFAGRITDWGTVGGQPGQVIQVIVREPESSTRASFDAYFFDGAKQSYPNAINVVESKEAYAQIRALKGSIAMVTLQTSTQNDPTMRLLALDGVAATTANLQSAAYPIRRPVYFFTSSDPAKVKAAVRALAEFIKGPEGQQILSTF